MLKSFKSQLNFALSKIKKTDSKFRITHMYSNNDKHNILSFGNSFNILTKIDPNLAMTFTIIDEIDDKLILTYNTKTTVNIVGFNTSYTKYETKYHAFNKKEFLKQLSYLETSQKS